MIPRKKFKNNGFTLVELMVVVAIIVIMGFFAAPEIMNFRPNMELNSASRQLYGTLQNCKLLAVRHNANCAVTFNQTVGPDTFSYYVFLDVDKDFLPDGTETVIDSYQLADYRDISFDTTKGGGDGITFPNNTAGNPGIGFQPNGLPDAPGGLAPNGTVFINNVNNISKSVVVSQAGNISIK